MYEDTFPFRCIFYIGKIVILVGIRVILMPSEHYITIHYDTIRDVYFASNTIDWCYGHHNAPSGILRLTYGYGNLFHDHALHSYKTVQMQTCFVTLHSVAHYCQWHNITTIVCCYYYYYYYYQFLILCNLRCIAVIKFAVSSPSATKSLGGRRDLRVWYKNLWIFASGWRGEQGKNDCGLRTINISDFRAIYRHSWSTTRLFHTVCLCKAARWWFSGLIFSLNFTFLYRKH